MTVWPALSPALLSSAETGLVGSLDGRDIILPATEDRPWPVRAHLWPAGASARGRVLILPGFTEFCEKYALFARTLVTAGYDCLIIDWPGQGRSGQLGSHQLIVHIDQFSDYLDALDQVLLQAGWQQGAFHVFGHSMGGHLALNLARNRPHLVDRLALSAPMIVPDAPPVWLTRFLAGLLIAAGYRYRALPFVSMPGLAERRKFRLNNRLTRFAEGYDRQYQIFETQPALRRVHASVGWIRAAFDNCALTTLNPAFMADLALPVLALIPGDETVIDKAASQRMLACLPDCRTVLFPEARHELLSERPEVTARLCAELDLFLRTDHADQITTGLART